MNFLRQVARMLDDEHRASIALLDKVGHALHTRNEAGLQALAEPLRRQLEHEIGRHFSFEERELFTRLTDAGDGPMAALLSDEHDTLRAVAAELLPLATALAGGTLAEADRPALRQLAVELVERQVSHIQKETMALLPMLDDLLDEDTDRDLAFAYSASA